MEFEGFQVSRCGDFKLRFRVQDVVRPEIRSCCRFPGTRRGAAGDEVQRALNLRCLRLPVCCIQWVNQCFDAWPLKP